MCNQCEAYCDTIYVQSCIQLWYFHLFKKGKWFKNMCTVMMHASNQEKKAKKTTWWWFYRKSHCCLFRFEFHPEIKYMHFIYHIICHFWTFTVTAHFSFIMYSIIAHKCS
jgi:hypothetical protein